MLNFLSSGGSAPPPGEQSVLQAWNEYSSGDAEAGLPLLPPITGRIGDAARKAGATIRDAATSTANAVPSAGSLQTALLLFAAGGLMLFLAFFVGLPVLVLSPSKFALSFSLGNLLLIAGAGVLSGFGSLLSHACTAERAPISIGYGLSAAGTLYASLVAHSYLLALLCSLAQVVALGALVIAYLPGGTSGLKLLASTGTSYVRSALGR